MCAGVCLAPLSRGRRFEVPRVLLTREGRDHGIDPGGSFWRAMSFIDAAETFDTIKDPGTPAKSAMPWACSKPPERSCPRALADTLPGFHITPGYLAHYDEVLARQTPAHPPK